MFWERRDKEVNNWDICNLLTDDQPSSSRHSLVLYGMSPCQSLTCSVPLSLPVVISHPDCDVLHIFSPSAVGGSEDVFLSSDGTSAEQSFVTLLAMGTHFSQRGLLLSSRAWHHYELQTRPRLPEYQEGKPRHCET